MYLTSRPGRAARCGWWTGRATCTLCSISACRSQAGFCRCRSAGRCPWCWNRIRPQSGTRSSPSNRTRTTWNLTPEPPRREPPQTLTWARTTNSPASSSSPLPATGRWLRRRRRPGGRTAPSSSPAARSASRREGAEEPRSAQGQADTEKRSHTRLLHPI